MPFCPRCARTTKRTTAGFAEHGPGAGAVSPPRESSELLGVAENFEDADSPALR